VNLTLDSAGKEVAGTDAVTEIRDIWTFERDLGSPDPTWRLVAARSA
jgi:predicted lipid-binding transport protein (Tim44 family)